ncbi:hypothetical protein J4460_04300 [Candidatus Woesearchaeota archaeon]|nr:hypothetical protein [Candidatus Woesearchaeota archaeon]HIJ04469.1 hypothetical protein [Candidatus Woesearchaeota archaeon]
MGKKGFFILIILLLLFLLSNYMFIHTHLEHSYLMRNRKVFAEQKQNISLLILGDSHAMNDLRQGDLPGAFNFASLGENMEQTAYLFSSLLAQNQFHPKILILPLDPNTLSSYKNERFLDEWYWKDHLNFFKLAKDHHDPRLYLVGIHAYVPLIGRLSEWVIPPVLEHPGPTDEHAQRRVAEQLGGATIIDDQAILSLQSIFHNASQNNITVFLVKFPLSHAYLENILGLGIPMDTFYENISSLLADEHYILLDYQILFIENDSLFLDSDHLNREGSRILATRISQNLSKHTDLYMTRNLSEEKG